MTFLIPSLLALVAAAIPLYAWYLIIHRKNREGMNSRFWLSFMLSGVGAFLFVFFLEEHFSFEEYSFPVFLILIFAFGIAIEYYKNFMVRISGVRYFKNVDDVIDLSFAAALGFSFVENVFHFTLLFADVSSDPVNMVKIFLIREFFILPIHLFCSGIFGYFYGVGLFGGEELRKKNRNSFWFGVLSLLLFFVPQKRRFKAVKILQGTLFSGFFYALFFAFYQINPRISDVFGLFDIPTFGVDESLVILLAFIIFQAGTILFFSLMDKKRRWEDEGYFSEQP